MGVVETGLRLIRSLFGNPLVSSKSSRMGLVGRCVSIAQSSLAATPANGTHAAYADCVMGLGLACFMSGLVQTPLSLIGVAPLGCPKCWVGAS